MNKFWCSLIHRSKYKCYPEVWGQGLEGPSHCTKCHPCNEALDKILKKMADRPDLAQNQSEVWLP